MPAVLGSSGRLAVGDDVIAIGNPLGLTDTTTEGVVSGLGRPAVEPGNVHLAGLIQFDAAVNPGSSGGPLLNGKGETVGIVVALANPTSAGHVHRHRLRRPDRRGGRGRRRRPRAPQQ